MTYPKTLGLQPKPQALISIRVYGCFHCTLEPVRTQIQALPITLCAGYQLGQWLWACPVCVCCTTNHSPWLLLAKLMQIATDGDEGNNQVQESHMEASHNTSS